MDTVMKRFISVLILISMVLSLTACGGNRLSTDTLTLEHQTKFGGIYAHITIDDFNKLGFEYGDSVDVEISNGCKMEDIPYFSGYYNKRGELLVCAYQGYPYLHIAANNGEDIYVTKNLSDKDTVVIRLREKGKYKEQNDALSTTYSDNREDYKSDSQFANFRVMDTGKLKGKNMFYRSASPCDNQHNRAPYVSALCEQAGIKYVLNLSDNEEETKKYYEDKELNIPYWKGLYEDKKVRAFNMGSAILSDDYRKKVAEIMRTIINNEGPFLIHCMEGKDRTGVVCAIIEILADSSLNEITDDYMKTYEEYYGITKESDPKKYEKIMEVKFGDILSALNRKEADKYEISELKAGVEKYLKDSGMTDEEISTLENVLQNY